MRKEVFEVRRMTAADLTPEFMECLESLGPTEDVRSDVGLAAIRETFRRQLRAGWETIVALSPNGKIVGTASYFVKHCYHYHGARVCLVEDVAVHNACQRRGVGACLVKFIEAEARRLTCRSIAGRSRAGAVEFYRKLGFRIGGPGGGFQKEL